LQNDAKSAQEVPILRATLRDTLPPKMVTRNDRLLAPVEEISLARFTGGRRTWIRAHELPGFVCPDVIRRVRSRVSENRYSLLSSNCEHFCECCFQGEHRRYQGDSICAVPQAALRSIRMAVAGVLTVQPLHIRAEADRF
jgi:hypothetical protein